MADQHSRRTGMFWLDISVALAAVCISVASFWVALRESSTQERLLSASVWPTLLYQTGDYFQAPGSTLPQQVIGLRVTNAGIGPARIKWFSISYRGRNVPDAATLLRRCCHAGRAQLPQTITNYMASRVLVAHESVDFIQIPHPRGKSPAWDALDRERRAVKARGCYCDVLDHCWLLDSTKNEPAPVAECPPPDTPQYNG